MPTNIRTVLRVSAFGYVRTDDSVNALNGSGVALEVMQTVTPQIVSPMQRVQLTTSRDRTRKKYFSDVVSVNCCGKIYQKFAR